MIYDLFIAKSFYIHKEVEEYVHNSSTLHVIFVVIFPWDAHDIFDITNDNFFFNNSKGIRIITYSYLWVEEKKRWGIKWKSYQRIFYWISSWFMGNDLHKNTHIYTNLYRAQLKLEFWLNYSMLNFIFFVVSVWCSNTCTMHTHSLTSLFSSISSFGLMVIPRVYAHKHIHALCTIH